MSVRTRPSRFDKDIQVGAARQFAPELTAWDKAWVLDEDELAKVGRVLAEEYDAYKAVRRLESLLNLDGDAELVDALDNGQWVFQQYLRDQIKLWAGQVRAELPLKLFDRVRHPRYGLGTIVRIDPMQAVYGFRPKNEEDQMERNRGHLIVNAEDFPHGLKLHAELIPQQLETQ